MSVVLLSSIVYRSLLSYTSKGNWRAAEKSRTVCYDLKNDKMLNADTSMSKYIADEVRKTSFSDYFSSDTVLVPIPRSTALPENGLWVPRCLAIELSNRGLGRPIECLKRVKELPKSSSVPWDIKSRPRRHYESMCVETMVELKKIVLVDDVITTGATILGAASLLAERFPNAEIRAFAAVRAVYEKEFERFDKSHDGEINLDGEHVQKT